MDNLSAILDFLVVSVFSEVFAVYFLLGLAIFIAGLLLLVLFILSRSLGYRTTGTVIGAVEHKRIKRKQRNNETVEKLKKTLYPVYEYTTKSGETRQMRASDGGTSTLSYSTGQSVSLIVREDDGYDDVYDSKNKGALYFGLVLAVIGVVIMSSVGTATAGVGISFTLIVLVGVALLVRGALAKFDREGSPAENVSDQKREPYSKAFDPADLHPIEHFKTQ